MGADLGGADIEVLAKRYEGAVRQLQQALASWEECSLAQEQLTGLRLKMARVYAEAGQSDASENVLRTIEAESERDKLQIKQIHSLNSTTERRVAEVFETAAANDMSASSVGRRRAAGAMLFVVVASVLASTIYQTVTGQLRDARDNLVIGIRHCSQCSIFESRPSGQQGGSAGDVGDYVCAASHRLDSGRRVFPQP